MSPGQVYLKAAKLIAENKRWHSCTAVGEAAGEFISHDSPRPFTRRYRAVFCPEQIDVPYRGVDLFVCAINDSGVDHRELRVLMLCLMAACWKDMVQP